MTKVKQEDLRRLMRERREKKATKVVSPSANKSSQLNCTICNVQVKNNCLWPCHIASKTHKENALKKRKADKEEDINPAKKFKVPVLLPKTEPDKKSTKSDPSDLIPSNSNASPNTILPVDTLVTEEVTPVQTLPEGFFDDPVLDAKARKIEYKDPIEEEWEKYQKAIAEETNVSKTIMDEDLEESVLERDIAQIDEQIVQWKKVKELETLADKVKVEAPFKDKAPSGTNYSDEELNEEDLLDWRTKSVARS